eukprot:7064560-Prymnesium_polylepis.1
MGIGSGRSTCQARAALHERAHTVRYAASATRASYTHHSVLRSCFARSMAVGARSPPRAAFG